MPIELTSPAWPPRPHALPRAVPARLGAPGWGIAAAALVGGFLAAQLAFIVTMANGPTLDEGIYMTAGRRTLDGHGLADGYLSWFAGSLLWPALAGLADEAAGLAGARALAAVFVTVAVAATWRASSVLYGPRAGFFTAALAVALGPTMALGHLAVIDAPAVAGVAVALWSITELARRDHRGWLVLAAAAFSVGVLAKYPAGVFALPLLGVLAALRGRRAPMDAAVFVLVASAILLTYFLSARGQVGYFLGWRVENNPDFGVTPAMIAFSQAWYGALPLLLGLGGWFASRRKRLATALLAGAVLFPLYHLGTGTAVGDGKQVVFGFVFVLPLAGRLLGRLARPPDGKALAALLVLAVAGFGAFQARLMERAWIDVDPAAEYLAGHARPGQQFLIDNAWPFIRRLYADGKLDSPWEVYDTYRVEHGQARTPVCRLDWFVAAHGAGTWPSRVRRQVRRCGTFRRVYRQQAPVTALGRDLRFVTWDASVQIYRNTAGGRAG